MTEEERPGPVFWVALVLGWAVIGYGIWGVLDDRARTQPPELARWVLGTLVLHDALLVPLVTVTAVLLAAVLPPLVRGPVRGGLALTGLVVLFSYPLWRGFGRHELNPSTLPLDYPRNVMGVVALIWVAAVVVTGWRVWRGARSGSVGS